MNEEIIDIKEEIKDSLFNLALTADILNGCEDRISEDVLEFLRENLRGSLFSSIKILAEVFGKTDIYDWTDAYLVCDKGNKGLDELLYKYGIISEPSHLIKNRERPKFALRIFELSQKEMTDSRREIYVECENFGSDILTKQILDLIEDVTQGIKPWSKFQREVIIVLSPHIESIITETKFT